MAIDNTQIEKFLMHYNWIAWIVQFFWSFRLFFSRNSTVCISHLLEARDHAGRQRSEKKVKQITICKSPFGRDTSMTQTHIHVAERNYSSTMTRRIYASKSDSICTPLYIPTPILGHLASSPRLYTSCYNYLKNKRRPKIRDQHRRRVLNS